MDAKTIGGETPLDEAARSGHKDVAELLLANKANVNAKDENGDTPLLFAARNGHADVVELLLDNKADVNLKNKLGETPLHAAAGHGPKEVVALLLSNKANVNAKDERGDTRLHYVTDQRYFGLNGGGEYTGIVELLLENKADVNTTDNNFATPLDLALSRRSSKMAEVLRKYAGRAFSTEFRDAATSGDLEKARVLLKENPDLVSIRDEKGETPLLSAANSGQRT